MPEHPDPISMTSKAMSHNEPESDPDPIANVPGFKGLFAPNGLATAMPFAAVAWDRDNRIVGWNAAAERLFGWSAEEAVGHLGTDLLTPPADRDFVRHRFSQLLRAAADPKNVRHEMTKSGDMILCEWQTTMLRDESGEVVGGFSVGRDVTDEHKAQRERERLHEIAAAANSSQDLDEMLRTIRDAVIETGGFDRAGVWWVDGTRLRGSWGTDESGRLRDERTQTMDFEGLGQAREVLDGARPYGIYRVDQTTPPCRKRPVVKRPTDRAVIALRARGELVGVLLADNLLSDRPITESDLAALIPLCLQTAAAIASARLLAERNRMIERHERFGRLIAAISATTSLKVILRMVRDTLVDVGGFDRASVYLYDRDREALVGTWGTDRSGQVIDESDLEVPVPDETDDQSSAVVRLDQPYSIRDDYTEQYGISPDSAMYGVRDHASVRLLAAGEVVGVIFVDNLLSGAPITRQDVEALFPFADQAAVAIQNARLFEDLRKAQDALVRSEKLRAIGELASGVAHNVNNILTAVLGYAELIEEADGATHEIQRFAQTVERAALDGAEIVRRVQQFARSETPAAMVAIDLAAIAGEAVELTRPVWHTQASARGARIEVVNELEGPLAAVGAPSELREVVVNLITNAVDSMPDGGTISIRGGLEPTHVLLSIADTGCGMEEATRRRVFEPFFTTKGNALGTGLGLSVAWGILRRHGGFIEVDSAPGRGSVFTIRLPVRSQEEQSMTREDEPARLAGLSILLVEDEALIADSLERLLTSHGARVVCAPDAETALSWLAMDADAYDVVLSDHGMGGMTGMQLLQHVRDSHPRLRRLLLSGWGESLPGSPDCDAAELILTKPIRGKDLMAALASVTSRGAP